MRSLIFGILLTPLALLGIINPHDCYWEETKPEMLFANGGIDYFISELIQSGIATNRQNAGELAIEEINNIKSREHNYFFSIRERKHPHSLGYFWYFVNDHNAFIEMIFLEPEYRNSGLGTYILTTLEKEFSEKGLHAIRLHVFAHNERAQNFYKKLGYHLSSTNEVRYKVVGFYLEKSLL